MNLNYWRQMDILPPSAMEGASITVVGAGGIGAPTVLGLAKMGFQNIAVYDDDVLESHNLPNQLYPLSAKGRPKVEALRDVVQEFSGVEIDAHCQRFVAGERVKTQFLISAVDSMTSRRAVWAAARYNPSIRLFIDGRMGGYVIKALSVRPTTPDQVKWYEATLHDDPPPERAEPCTARAIIYNCFLISSLICNAIRQELMRVNPSKEVIFDFQTMQFYEG